MEDHQNNLMPVPRWLAVLSVPAVSSSSNLMLPCQDKPKGGFCFRYFLHARTRLLEILRNVSVKKCEGMIDGKIQQVLHVQA